MFDVGNKPILAAPQDYIHQPVLHHEFSQIQFQVDQPRRQYSLILAMLWHIFGILAYLITIKLEGQDEEK